jgi:anhydro-N-acetylmuramic acid kinase
MSGTSLDGIDISEINFSLSDEGVWKFEILTSETVAYSSAWKQKLQKAISFSENELLELNLEFTTYLSEVIIKFINKHKVQYLDAVCSHGHTILHRPDEGITLQIGNLPQLAQFIKQKVVCDFRVQDVQLGGQGAPLVPIGDALLFNEYDYCLNLGGFANISFENDNKRIAFDVCPVNIVLNHLAEKLGFPFDESGKLAASGILNEPLLAQLNALAFYKEAPPKSLGLEWVKKFVFPLLDEAKISPEDKLRTFVEHLAIQISSCLEKDLTVLVTGGGAYNDFLITKIQSFKKVRLVVPAPSIIEYKEALIFGLLGVLKLRNEFNCLASVTGAIKDHSGGNIFFP